LLVLLWRYGRCQHRLPRPEEGPGRRHRHDGEDEHRGGVAAREAVSESHRDGAERAGGDGDRVGVVADAEEGERQDDRPYGDALDGPCLAPAGGGDQLFEGDGRRRDASGTDGAGDAECEAAPLVESVGDVGRGDQGQGALSGHGDADEPCGEVDDAADGGEPEEDRTEGGGDDCHDAAGPERADEVAVEISVRLMFRSSMRGR
jgi:hypothetical protein